MAKVRIDIEVSDAVVKNIQEPFSSSSWEEFFVLEKYEIDEDHVLEGIELYAVCVAIANDVLKRKFV